jgi:hypothetical protein
MGLMNESTIDVPVNDTDYDYEKFMEEQKKMDADDMMVGVSYDEEVEGDTLSFSPEEI